MAAPTGPATAPAAAPAAAPPPAVPMPTPTGCAPGVPVIGSRLASVLSICGVCFSVMVLLLRTRCAWYQPVLSLKPCSCRVVRRVRQKGLPHLFTEGGSGESIVFHLLPQHLGDDEN